MIVTLLHRDAKRSDLCLDFQNSAEQVNIVVNLLRPDDFTSVLKQPFHCLLFIQ